MKFWAPETALFHLPSVTTVIGALPPPWSYLHSIPWPSAAVNWALLLTAYALVSGLYGLHIIDPERSNTTTAYNGLVSVSATLWILNVTVYSPGIPGVGATDLVTWISPSSLSSPTVTDSTGVSPSALTTIAVAGLAINITNTIK